jgi:hypothetical protein
LQTSAFRLGFARSLVIRDTKVLEELFEQPSLFVVDPTLSVTPTLPRSPWTVEHEKQLYIERKEAANAVKYGFLDTLEGWFI